MSPKLTPKGESSRQQILEAAYQIFLEKGFHAATMRDIALRCRLTTGGVYTHFRGKDEIFEAVLAQHNPILQVLPAIQASQGDTVEALVQDAARRMVSALGMQHEALNLVFIEVVEFQGRHFNALFPVVFPQFMEIISHITSLGDELRPEISLPILVRSFFGLFFSYFLTNIVFSTQLSFDEQTLNRFVDIYLYGILVTQPDRKLQTPPSSPKALP
ncbi:MAG: TetR/AcrR family transcriptional regulator [Chloroflexi bacterium]|nr:TetR/AcrR family transcriptional regulator [Chloroflexota bacterium]